LRRRVGKKRRGHDERNLSSIGSSTAPCKTLPITNRGLYGETKPDHSLRLNIVQTRQSKSSSGICV
jgi:hypothetical protein